MKTKNLILVLSALTLFPMVFSCQKNSKKKTETAKGDVLPSYLSNASYTCTASDIIVELIITGLNQDGREGSGNIRVRSNQSISVVGNSLVSETARVLFNSARGEIAFLMRRDENQRVLVTASSKAGLLGNMMVNNLRRNDRMSCTDGIGAVPPGSVIAGNLPVGPLTCRSLNLGNINVNFAAQNVVPSNSPYNSSIVGTLTTSTPLATYNLVKASSTSGVLASAGQNFNLTKNTSQVVIGTAELLRNVNTFQVRLNITAGDRTGRNVTNDVSTCSGN